VTDLVERPMDAVEALALVGLRHRVGHFPSRVASSSARDDAARVLTRRDRR
jgi:hypothetical protein